MGRSHRALPVAFVAVALAAGLAGCSPSCVTVTEADDGTIQSARVGERVVVRLDGNPSTGFTWSRTTPIDDNMAGTPLLRVQEGEWEFPRGGSAPGAPGVCVFEYQVVRPGIVTLSYTYARPWEESQARTIAFTLWARE